MPLGMNIFPIVNANEITSEYKMYRIKGLNNAPDEFYSNCQYIIKKLSFDLRSPVTIIHPNGIAHLIVQTDCQPPASLSLVRTIAKFEEVQSLALDYTFRSPENDTIAQRFLDFAIQGKLYKRTDLWQPQAGKPFFEKEGTQLGGNLVLYRGFAIRSVITPSGSLGFCVDLTSKIVSDNPLPHYITQDKFEAYRNRTFVYRYGHQWYEVKLTALSDFHASEQPIDGTDKPLLEWVTDHSQKPIPQELADIPHDAAVGIYLNNQNQTRSVLTSLCYQVQRASDAAARKYHRKSIHKPYTRRQETIKFVKKHLQFIPFGKTPIQVSSKPFETEPKMFIVPDLLFGNNKVLSVRGTKGAVHTSLDALGRDRLSQLRDPQSGFYTQNALDRHYIVLPRSVAESSGQKFVADLTKEMSKLYPHPYQPNLVVYNDQVAKTYPKQGNAILEAVKKQCQQPGYAVVMIHRTKDQKNRQEDQLAAMVMRELRKDSIDIKATVIHTSVVRECYQEIRRSGNPAYEIRQDKKGKLSGYLRLVAINKILLNNERLPFILSSRLHADLTIGMDIKGNTVGFVVIGANGNEINTLFKTSRQKEKLNREQMKAYLVEIIRQEASIKHHPIRHIVLQRDGRLFDLEHEGIREAMLYLKEDEILPDEATITIIEISKSAPVRLRLFDIRHRDGRGPDVKNPQIGTYLLLTEKDAYLCSTGRAFRMQGTVRPLHVRHIEGPLSLENCLEDIFYLTCLPWTKPDGVMRNPITIKLIDRFLAEEATDYDDDALDIDAILDELEPEED
ncbi:MAG: hypothetical protein AAF846_24820 [Chloroflexota bacterium]